MNLYDTHAHLQDERFASDLDAVVARAGAAGLVRVIAIATTAADSATCVELAGRFPLLKASVGIQPNHVAQEPAGAWDEIVRLAGHADVLALGETGLDRYWDYTPFAQQEDFFARHQALARTLGKPLVIHCRQAEADMVRMLKADFDKQGPVRGVMHSFTGDAATAQACLEMGLFISFAGMVTYKNAADLRAVAAAVPLDRLLIETDCPYLTPMPHRGKRNEPAHVQHTAACLAGVKGLTVEELAEATTANARTLFERQQ